MSLGESIKKMKPFTKILLFGVLPMAVILMIALKPDTSNESEVPKEENPFFKNPEKKEVADKSNLDLYKEKKFKNNSTNTFSSGLTFDTKTEEELRVDSIEKENGYNSNDEIREKIRKEKQIKSSNSYYSSNKQQNRGYVNPHEYKNEKTSSENEVIVENNNQKRRRSGSGSGLMGGNNSRDNSKIGETTEIINAVVHNGNKEVKGGSTVRIRITEDCIINGKEVKRNSVVSGIADLSGERLKIEITSYKYNGKLYSCDLTTFDNDGIEGLYVPGGIQIKQDLAAESVNEGGTKINVPVIGSVGVGSLKKKIKEPTVKVYDNHKITLRQ